MRSPGLTDLQKLFVEEYLLDNNASAAAARAGYSPKSSGKIGSQLLGKTRIQEAIQEARQARSTRTELKADDVLKELSLIAYSDIGEIIDFTGTEPKLRPANEIPEGARRAIQSVKVRRVLKGKGKQARTVEITEFRLWSKPHALDKSGQHLGLFKDAASGPQVSIQVLVGVDEAKVLGKSTGAT